MLARRKPKSLQSAEAKSFGAQVPGTAPLDVRSGQPGSKMSFEAIH
jgi:hypothetical protein